MVKKILAVDDEEDILNEIESVFESCDDKCDIITSNSGKRAIDVIKNEKPDLVITAIDIDEINGMDIINEAKKVNIRTIVLSSRVDEETVDMIISYYKPKFYMKKPLDRGKLIENVRSIFNSKDKMVYGIPSDKIEAVFKCICDSIEQGIAIIDPSFNIIWVNKKLEDKGFTFDKVVGHKSYKIFENRDGPVKESSTKKTFENGKVNKVVKKGSDDHDYRITSIPIKNDKGEVIYVIEYGEDLTKSCGS